LERIKSIPCYEQRLTGMRKVLQVTDPDFYTRYLTTNKTVQIC